MAGKRKAISISADSDIRIDEDGFRINKSDYSALENIFLDWGWQRDKWWQIAKTRYIKIDENDDDRRVKAFQCGSTSMFKSLHPSIGQLQALDDLCIFCFPQLKNLPNEIGNLKNLTSLRLLGTHSLPPSIVQLQALRELRLWRSAKTLTTLPEEIGNLGNLIFLDLWESEYIKSLPSSIGQLRALQWFDLRDTRQLT
eukprot:CAMPEP_0116092754 /NCGR_PEP_ID=MMETSP0327-20121206/8213_1 /TAXON_ID=44447 /ORGANISM="Pseudo-nitzschia delicatissima, Strain B596" /LENGTH=197 /DNA_ID=CAMNT_0003584205 /DNA_START=17 /DNA_END=610 /DNA_ORIENTATION=+